MMHFKQDEFTRDATENNYTSVRWSNDWMLLSNVKICAFHPREYMKKLLLALCYAISFMADANSLSFPAFVCWAQENSMNVCVWVCAYVCECWERIKSWRHKLRRSNNFRKCVCVPIFDEWTWMCSSKYSFSYQFSLFNNTYDKDSAIDSLFSNFLSRS